MKKMFKSIPMLIITTIILISSLNTFAASPKVYDDASLFTPSQLETLNQSAMVLGENLQLDIVIVTTNDSKGKKSRDYADDFYDYNGFGYGKNSDGLLILINMDKREVWISTSGIAIDYFTDARIDKMLDKIQPHLSKANYFEASLTFLAEVEQYVQIGIPKGQYRSPQSKELTPINKLLIYLVISITIGGISVGVMSISNKGTSTTNQNTYMVDNSFKLVNKEDRLIDTKYTVVRINASSSSSKSSTHKSSSGRSHGGGGRKF